MTSPDTGAGTPPPLSAAEEATTREAAVLFEREPNGRLIRRLLATLDAARSRPATDPAGLDAAVGRLLGVTGTIAEANARGSLDPKHPYFWADLDAARQAVIAARGAVADGPGPEERADG